MLIEVTGCKDCPFADLQDYDNSCMAPGGKHLDTDYESKQEAIKNGVFNNGIFNPDDYIITPEWCPLKKETISVCINSNVL